MLPMSIKRDDVSSETNTNSQYLYELVNTFAT